MRYSSQSRLTWAVPSKSDNIPPFFLSRELSVNRLWLCKWVSWLFEKVFTCLNIISRGDLLPTIHINYSHSNWHFLRVLLQRHFTRLCERFMGAGCRGLCESVSTTMPGVWIHICMSNCETPLLWLLSLTYFAANINDHMRRVCRLLPDCKSVILVTGGVQGILRRRTSAVLLTSSHCGSSSLVVFKGRVLRRPELWLWRDYCSDRLKAPRGKWLSAGFLSGSHPASLKHGYGARTPHGSGERA